MVSITNKVEEFTQINPSVWNDSDQLKELSKKLHGAEKIIIFDAESNSPKEVERIKWSSTFLDVLTMQSQNPHKAEIIEESFNLAFGDMPEGNKKSSIKEFIKRNHVFLGIKKPHFDFSKSSIAKHANSKFIIKFDAFLESVSQKLKKLYQTSETVQKTDKIGVAILTCNNGGGHRIPAQAVKAHLDTIPKFETHIINIDELSDPLNTVTNGAIKSWQVFWKYRQENETEKANILTDIQWELHHFIPAQSQHEVNLKIQKLGSSIIINTVHHEPHRYATSPELDLPHFFINTDYELPPQLEELSEKTDNIKVFTPIDYKKSNPNLLPIGYPIRPGFFKKFSQEEKMQLRNKYGVGPNEDLIVVQMGSLAAGLSEDIEKMNKMRLYKKTHFVILCANNPKAKETIEKIHKDNAERKLNRKTAKNNKISSPGKDFNANHRKNKENIVFHAVSEFQNDEKMPLFFQASDEVFGKCGGCTSAEIAATEANLLVYKPFPWELPNLKYLSDRDQAKKISSIDDLQTYLNSKKRSIKHGPREPVLDWRSSIVDHLEKSLSTSKDEPASNSQPQDVKRPIKPYSNSKWFAIFVRHVKRALNSLKTVIAYLKHFFADSGSSSLKDTIRRIRLWMKYA